MIKSLKNTWVGRVVFVYSSVDALSPCWIRAWPPEGRGLVWLSSVIDGKVLFSGFHMNEIFKKGGGEDSNE